MIKYYNIFFVTLLLALSSCTDGILFNKNLKMTSGAWSFDEPVSFDIPVKDTINHYNLFINIRNDHDYPYSNLFIITRMRFPDRSVVTDTLEYEMTDNAGYFLGSGFSDVKENKLFYKENIRFPKNGIYHFEVRQAMRERNTIEPISSLEGVRSVGLSIEKN